eukprot:TRINITY_DN19429_c0_g1_i1.p2 TRINITY_DN19429_c0_g1~~TRINITY_DN19429_c0_g1_i1.p2  ORF type:complete len:124 (-),score=22.66 TRINITY_DN19429_c0_g1_i1:283-654(-)
MSLLFFHVCLLIFFLILGLLGGFFFFFFFFFFFSPDAALMRGGAEQHQPHRPIRQPGRWSRAHCCRSSSPCECGVPSTGNHNMFRACCRTRQPPENVMRVRYRAYFAGFGSSTSAQLFPARPQ